MLKPHVDNDRLEMNTLPDAHSRILLIEDDGIVAETTQEMFKALGYQVVVEQSSMDAWNLLRKDPRGFDLIITDLLMPGLSGDQLAAKMKRLRPDMPIFLITGCDREECKDRICEKVFSAVFYKPFGLETLVACVSEALSRAWRLD